MSAQPVENDLLDPDDLVGGSGEDGPDLAAAPEQVEIRRNAVVSLLIGGAASAIAIAYLWRAAGTGAPLDWLLCLLLGAMAAGFLRGLLDARTPLLVADEMGVRIRLGEQWRGLPWEAIDRVVIEPRRGLLRDGRVVISLYHVARAIEGLERRARRHAALNRKVYGAALAVPLGLTTRTSGGAGGDLADRIAELAQGRTDVVTVAEEPEPVVSSSARSAAPADSAERPVISDDTERETDRRPRWMRRIPSVTVTAEEDGHEDRGEEPARPDGGAEGDAAREPEGRTVPFRIGRREQVVPAPEGPEDEVGTTAADWPVAAPVPPGQTDPRVRSIASLGEPVAPLVIDDFAPEPAYDPVIGPELAAARTRVGLSVDELAERTRIRPHVIESIEVDDFAPCGGDFYARGHIRTLARVLGKDAVPLLAQFEARYAQAPVSARRVFEAELATGLAGGARRTSGGPNWALLVGVVLALVLAWSSIRLFAGQDNVLLENPPPVLNGSAGLGNAYGQPQAPQAPPPVETRLTAVNAGTHVEVRDGEGNLVFEGDLVMGEVKTVQADPPVTISGDNGGALAVSIGGRDTGFLGQADLPATRTYQRPQD